MHPTLWFPAKANRKPTGPHSPCSHLDSAQRHSIGLADSDLQGHTKRPIQSQWRDLHAVRAFCWTLGLNAQGEKNDSVQDLSHPINQVILTHPVTCRRLAEQRRHLSELDGTSSSGVMGKYTTPVSVINSVYCWNWHAVSNTTGCHGQEAENLCTRFSFINIWKIVLPKMLCKMLHLEFFHYSLRPCWW